MFYELNIHIVLFQCNANDNSNNLSLRVQP